MAAEIGPIGALGRGFQDGKDPWHPLPLDELSSGKKGLDRPPVLYLVEDRSQSHHRIPPGRKVTDRTKPDVAVNPFPLTVFKNGFPIASVPDLPARLANLVDITV